MLSDSTEMLRGRMLHGYRSWWCLPKSVRVHNEVRSGALYIFRGVDSALSVFSEMAVDLDE